MAWRRPPAPSACPRANPAPDLPEPSDQDRRALLAGRRRRYRGAGGWPAHGRGVQSIGDHREQAGRQHQHRLRFRRQIPRRRLHLAADEFVAGRQRKPLRKGHAVRPAARSGSGDDDRHHAGAAGGSPVLAGQNGQGPDCACQGKTRHADIRFRRHRQSRPTLHPNCSDGWPKSTCCTSPTRAVPKRLPI